MFKHKNSAYHFHLNLGKYMQKAFVKEFDGNTELAEFIESKKLLGELPEFSMRGDLSSKSSAAKNIIFKGLKL